MSKASEKKASQGYIDKVVPQACGNCKHFASDMVQVHGPTTWNPEGFFAEKNKRCALGGFAVKKMAT